MSSVLASVDQRTQLAGHNRLEILMFRLDGPQLYGLNVFKIQEVIQCPELTDVPQSHPVVRGIATLRGRTIPVLDLSMAIGGPRHPDASKAFVIVTEFNRSIQGFMVDMVDRIVNLNWEQILPPPRTAGRSNYLTAVTEVDGNLVEIIDVEKVLSEVIGMDEEVPEEVIERAREGRSYEPHILVADDSMVARNQIKRTLEALGIPCTLAMDGRRALDILEKWAAEEPEKLETLAMVISDIEMPEMDGYTFTTRVRENPQLADLYILLHTSLSGVFNESMVKKVGANEFIAKFKPDLLAESVLRQVERHGKRFREAS